MLAAQRLHLESQLSTAELSIADGARVLQELRAVGFSPEDEAALCEAVARRTTMSVAVSSAQVRSRLQNYASLTSYMNKSHWDLLSSERISSNVKLQAIVGHFVALQLRNPSEVSLQTLTALYLAATDGLDKAAGLSASCKHQTLLHLKRCLRAASAKAHFEAIVAELPRDPSEFQAAYPTVWAAVFAEAPPVACPLNEARFRALQASIPMRSSSKLLGMPSSPSGTAAADKTMALMLNMMQRMLGQGDLHPLAPAGYV